MTEKIINIILIIILIILVGITIFLILYKMNIIIDKECAKIYYEGTIKFWDADVNCSILK